MTDDNKDEIQRRPGGPPGTMEIAVGKMPPLKHWDRETDGAFDPMQSEVAEWLCAQPEVRNWIVAFAKTRQMIKYDTATGLWSGNPRKTEPGSRARGTLDWKPHWPPQDKLLMCLDDEPLTNTAWRGRMGRLGYTVGHWTMMHISRNLAKRGKIIAGPGGSGWMLAVVVAANKAAAEAQEAMAHNAPASLPTLAVVDV